ncbi:hypothetical protein [Phocaeicola massiliensis]|nr:hypothetical protein [Phocaeicola massiliensis]
MNVHYILLQLNGDTINRFDKKASQGTNKLFFDATHGIALCPAFALLFFN